MKENKANSCIIVEEERTHDISSPDHALKPATTLRTSKDPTSRGNKERNGDNARIISQYDLRPKDLPKAKWSSITSDLRSGAAWRNQSLARGENSQGGESIKNESQGQRMEISLRLRSSIYEAMIAIALEGNADSFL